MNKPVAIKELYHCENPLMKPYFDKATYPWELLPEIGKIVKGLIEAGLEGYKEVAPGVYVAEGVKIADTATLIGPAIIGKGTEIRPGAFLRGNIFIGEGCVIGNSSELKNAILLDHVQVPHYNYVGDSILGNYAHMGAGSICSNLRSDGKNIVIHGETEIETGLRKIGAFIGDHGDIGCGSVLNPGTIIGMNTSVYPLTSCRGVYPSNCIVKSTSVYVERK